MNQRKRDKLLKAAALTLMLGESQQTGGHGHCTVPLILGQLCNQLRILFSHGL
jgi:hypothetical protein